MQEEAVQYDERAAYDIRGCVWYSQETIQGKILRLKQQQQQIKAKPQTGK